MTYIELLKINRAFLEICKKNNVMIQDVKMIEIYEQYKQMMAEGNKKEYIMYKLSADAGITSRTLYTIIHRLESQISL